MADLSLRVKCDADYLRLVAYKMVLELIADAPEGWEADPDGPTPREMAEAVLRAMGDK
jgi:hypothetical protein